MKRHAYLIIAHNEFYILEQLLKLLDDERNDIYIHIDKKVYDINFNYFKYICKKSKVIFTDRVKVNWGGYSQIESELILLKAAIQNEYNYYHIISGVDLPLKSQDYIHEFFEKNQGKEFIRYVDKWSIDRIKYLYLLNEKLRGKYRSKNLIVKCLNKFIIFIQKILRYDHTKKFKEIVFKKGTNWMSITHECAKLVLSKEELIKDMFKYSVCADEVFIHTIYYNFTKNKNLYCDILNSWDANKRFIDWERGNPYIFTEEDFDSIINSGQLFARKFSINKDKKIIDKIVEHVLTCSKAQG